MPETNQTYLQQSIFDDIFGETPSLDFNSGYTSSISGNRNGNNSGIWTSLIENAANITSSLGSSIAGITAAATGNYPTVETEDQTPKVLAISVVAVIVLIIILLIIFNKQQ